MWRQASYFEKMLTFTELTSWTNDDIVTHTKALKPKDLSFRFGFDEDAKMWFTRFEKFDEGEQKRVTVWEGYGPDCRLTLFDAFGWVWARHQPPPPEGSPWKRRSGDLREVAKTGRMSPHGHRVPDPEDLDPSEIESVYRSSTDSKNRR